MTEQERLEEFLQKIEPLHDAAVAEQEQMSAFAKDLRDVIVTQALKHYPQIYDLDSDGFILYTDDTQPQIFLIQSRDVVIPTIPSSIIRRNRMNLNILKMVQKSRFEIPHPAEAGIRNDRQ
jgi:hypothetical protein